MDARLRVTSWVSAPMASRVRAALLYTTALGAIASCAAQGAAPLAARSIAAWFDCEDGKKIQAAFATGAQPSVTLTLSDGRKMVLPQAMAASGARYANRDASFVFWNKGRTAFIEEAGHQTYKGCVQAR